MKTFWKCLQSILLLMLVSCSASPSLVADDFPSRVLMAPQDLPSNWQRVGIIIEEIPDGKSRMVEYRVTSLPDKLYLGIKHTLQVYASEQSATNAYETWEPQYFPTDAWQAPDVNGEFTPVGVYRLGCMKASMNNEPYLTCGYLQAYKNLMSIVLANVDEKNITMEQFINALKILDIRMGQYQ